MHICVVENLIFITQNKLEGTISIVVVPIYAGNSHHTKISKGFFPMNPYYKTITQVFVNQMSFTKTFHCLDTLIILCIIKLT